MDKDASLVDHCEIERAPVLEEGEIEELVIDREVVVSGIVIGGCGGAASWCCAYAGIVCRIRRLIIEQVWAWRRVGECCKVEPVENGMSGEGGEGGGEHACRQSSTRARSGEP